MKIKVPTLVDIELTQENKNDITITTLRELLKWPEGAYVEGDNLVQTKTYHTSHSWTDTEVIRTATATDVAFQILIEIISQAK